MVWQILLHSLFTYCARENTSILPFFAVLKSGESFAMAGIYAREPTEFGTAETKPVNFAILTTKANGAVSFIHERMPVILPLGREKNWLPAGPSGAHFVPPLPAELLRSYPVTPKMNRASFNDPEAIQPLDPSYNSAGVRFTLFPAGKIHQINPVAMGQERL